MANANHKAVHRHAPRHHHLRAAQPAAQVGSWAKAKFDIPACPVWDDFEKIGTLLYEKDEAAFNKKHCPVIYGGTKVYVEDVAILHEAFCVRPAGNPSCSWVPQSGIWESSGNICCLSSLPFLLWPGHSSTSSKVSIIQRRVHPKDSIADLPRKEAEFKKTLPRKQGPFTTPQSPTNGR